jgi:hypothetical protein
MTPGVVLAFIDWLKSAAGVAMLGEAPTLDSASYVTLPPPIAAITCLIKQQNVLPEQEVAGMCERARAC